MNKISILILTYNEEKHIERCIKSLDLFGYEIFIVDSFSNDRTVEIAKSLGAKVYFNKWINYAKQFQWGLDNCLIKTKWVMRVDADEIILPDLANEIVNKIDRISEEVSGIYIKRRMFFKNKWIRFGGKYPEWLLRIWKHKKAYIEERWMDEHIVLKEGKTIRFNHDIVDYNLNDLTWWTHKHNKYATREAIDVLSSTYGFQKTNQVSPSLFGKQEQSKRKLKNLYVRLPLFIRPLIYFIWRYFFLLGFLDGKRGLIWHFLQAYWYRFLVDSKIYEIKEKAKTQSISIENVLVKDYGLKKENTNNTT
jgi:glycosyltransferase involved in cell wall biosynthesis